MKKTNNPFKMIGSYAGLVLSLILPTIVPNIWAGGLAVVPFPVIKALSGMNTNAILLIIVGLIIPLIGFFSGYFIQKVGRKSKFWAFILSMIFLIWSFLWVFFVLIVGSLFIGGF